MSIGGFGGGGVLGDQIENVAVAASHLVIVKHHREKTAFMPHRLHVFSCKCEAAAFNEHP